MWTGVELATGWIPYLGIKFLVGSTQRDPLQVSLWRTFPIQSFPVVCRRKSITFVQGIPDIMHPTTRRVGIQSRSVKRWENKTKNMINFGFDHQKETQIWHRLKFCRTSRNCSCLVHTSLYASVLLELTSSKFVHQLQKVQNEVYYFKPFINFSLYTLPSRVLWKGFYPLRTLESLRWHIIMTSQIQVVWRHLRSQQIRGDNKRSNSELVCGITLTERLG